jgi:hypothetical protein
MDVPCARKKERILFLVIFVSSLTWRWGENLHLSCLKWPSGQEDLGGLMHTPMLILRYPKSMQEEIPTLSNLSTDLLLKWSSGGSEGVGESRSD